MNIAYFDCFAGAGGDMIVAAMLDAGLNAEFLKAQLKSLALENLDIKITQTKRCGLKAVSFVPAAPIQQQPHSLEQITGIISRSKIAEAAKDTAITLFNKLAQAEATVHNQQTETVHFHEVGALDSIADIVSASVGLEFFRNKGLKKVYCSALSLGSGMVKTAHGIFPIPAPATAELVKAVPVVAGPGEIELLTPTAAAILTTIVDEFCPLPAMKIESVGYGAGSFQSDKFPNVLRLILGQTAPAGAENADSVYLLETNVDDASGELIGFVTEQLFEAGALDVFTTPIYMKHSRPAVKISAVCEIAHAQKLEQILFEQAITFGVRKQILQRSKLERDFVTVDTEFGRIKIKAGRIGTRVVSVKPEFADCVSAAKKHNVTVKAVQQAAINAYKRD